jgi:hypothetical protein
MLINPITAEMIHTMGALFVDNTDLYICREGVLDPADLWVQTQMDLKKGSCLLNATGGALKPENCFWYMLDSTCMDGKWMYA